MINKDNGEIPEAARLESVLIETTSSEHYKRSKGIIAIDDSIDSIDLGRFGKEADAMLLNSFWDEPHHRERGKMAYVMPGTYSSIVFSKEEIGTETEDYKLVDIPVDIITNARGDVGTFPPRDRQDKFPACVLHTHGDGNFPPSPPDLKALLTSEISISPSILVITEKTKYVICRGKQTPQLKNDELEKKISQWKSQLKERIDTSKYSDNYNGNAFHETAIMLLELAKENDLAIFTCPSDQNTVTKKTRIDEIK